MLTSLGHHALVGRDDEEREIDAAHPRQHVLDEALVARHVHDLDGEAARLLEEGEAEVNRYASRFLFGQTIGIRPGQRLDERRLAMIDVPGGTYNHMLGRDTGPVHHSAAGAQTWPPHSPMFAPRLAWLATSAFTALAMPRAT